MQLFGRRLILLLSFDSGDKEIIDLPFLPISELLKSQIRPYFLSTLILMIETLGTVRS